MASARISDDKSNFPTHPSAPLSLKSNPVAKFKSQIRGVPIEIESKLQALISESGSVALDERESPSDFINNEEHPSIDISALGGQINNSFRQPFNSNSGSTGTVLEEDGVLYVQKCLHGEYYYESCKIYGHMEESTNILAHSTNAWTLCNTAPSFKEDPLVKCTNEFDTWLLEDNRRMVHQGMLDEFIGHHVYEADTEHAQ